VIQFYGKLMNDNEKSLTQQCLLVDDWTAEQLLNICHCWRMTELANFFAT